MFKNRSSRRDKHHPSVRVHHPQFAPRMIPDQVTGDAAFRESLRAFTREHSQRPADAEPWIELTPAGRAALARAAAGQLLQLEEGDA